MFTIKDNSEFRLALIVIDRASKLAVRIAKPFVKESLTALLVIYCFKLLGLTSLICDCMASK